MRIQLATPYNGYTHASLETVSWPDSTIYFRLCHEADAPRDELNTAPFAALLTAAPDAIGAAIAADITAALLLAA